MYKKHAKQIADLLNQRNQLTDKYYADKILELANNYEYLTDENDNIIAAVQIKKVQWYQWELCHLTVSPAHEGKEYAKRLIKEAEKKAIKGRARIIQCTIRENNEPSQRLFSKNGYKNVSTFFNPDSENNVGVWQKILSPTHK